jgi:hypothetical protein
MAGPPYQQGRRKVSWEDGSVSYETPKRSDAIRGAQARFEGQGHVDKGGVVSKKSMKPGGGGRFDAFVSRLVSEGKSASSAKAIAASAGRKKYGSAQMAAWSAKGRKRA